jgi:hypothetical protein
MFKTKMRSMKKLHLIGVITLLAPFVSVASVATDSSHSTKAVNSNDSMDTITVDIHQCGAGVSLWPVIRTALQDKEARDASEAVAQPKAVCGASQVLPQGANP